MHSKACFEEAVRVFLEEMSSICLLETPESLRHLLGFKEEVDERRKLFGDPNSTDVSILSSSFGLVDEYVSRKWSEIIEDIYAEYTAKQAAKERSEQRGI